MKEGGWRDVTKGGYNVWDEEDGVSLEALCPIMFPVEAHL